MIIAFAGIKGGTGKSTVAFNIAGEGMAREKKVLLGDADSQKSALTWVDTAVKAKQPAPRAIGLSTSMVETLPGLADIHDLTLIDCPPRSDEMTAMALMVCDVVVVPTGPASTEFWALDAGFNLIRQAQLVRRSLRAVLLLNKLQARQRLSAHAREDLQGSLERARVRATILETTLHMRTPFAESPSFGMSVATFAPNSPAADEIRRLFDELEALHG